MRRLLALLRRRGSVRVAWPVMGIAFLAVLTVVLAQAPAGASFTTNTRDTGNSVTAAANFCTAPGSRSLVVHDSYSDEADPNTTHQSTPDLHVRAAAPGNRAYTWLLFDLSPSTLPTGCRITTATMQVYDYQPSTASRTISVQRSAATWSAASIDWTNQPGVTTDAAATSVRPGSAAYQSWDVTALVQAQYDGGNTGFRLSDLGSTSGGPYENLYYDQNNASVPKLSITWGR